MGKPISLGNLFTIRRALITPQSYPSEAFNYYSIPAYDQNRTPQLTRGEIIESTKFLVEPDTILISKLNPRIRRVWQVGRFGSERSLASTELLNLVPEATDTVLFLYYLLLSNQIYGALERCAEGTTNSHVRFHASDLERIQLDQIPPVSEWSNIAEILTVLDTQIAHTEALIAKFQQIKAGLMHDLFTRGVTPDGRLRPEREEAPHLYANSLCGWIPTEWEAVPAKDLCELITKGTTPGESSAPQSPSSIPFLRVQNLSYDGRVVFDEDSTYVSLSVARGELSRSRVFPGDVLMNIVGPPLGKVSLVPETYIECNINQAIAVFRLSKPELRSYLRWYLLSRVAMHWFLQRAKRTSGQVNITLEMCSQLPIPCPRDGEELLKITNMLDDAQARIESEENLLQKLVFLKNGLSYDLLTGRVRVDVKGAPTA